MQGKTVHKSVQAWLYDTVYQEGEDETQEGYNRDNFTILHQRPIRISRRIERAVGMNLTDKWASVPYQAGFSTAEVEELLAPAVLQNQLRHPHSKDPYAGYLWPTIGP